MPTIKQIKAVKETLENLGSKNPKTQSQILIDNGYSETTALNNPKAITTSKGWLELMEEYLPESELARVHKEGLSATRKVFKNNNKKGEIEEVAEEPDYSVRHKYLETGYKIRGKLVTKEPEDAPVVVNINIANVLQKVYGGAKPRELPNNS